MIDLERDFLASVHIPHGDGCWLWTASKETDRGYGVRSYHSGTRRFNFSAHRLAHRLWIGPIPARYTVDHVCHNEDPDCLGGPTCPHRACVNPAHLEAVPRAVNVLRGKGIAAVLARATHCKRGHPFSGENLWIDPVTGARQCRVCLKLRRSPAWRAR